MRRREFITLVGGAAVAWPFAARAQQPAMPVIGFLHAGSALALVDAVEAFRDGLNESSYIEGRNVTIEYRWAENRYDHLSGLLAGLVSQRVAVIFAGALPAALVAKAASTTTPVVFLIGGDPIDAGLVNSLNRPSGNMTGVTVFSGTLLAKRLELLQRVTSAATTIAVLVNPKNPNAESRSSNIDAAARRIGLQPQFLNASNETDLNDAFATMVQRRVSAMLVVDDPFFTSHRDQLVTLAARNAIPSIYFQREFVVAGGLMSYATKYSDMYKQAGIYAGQILKGKKPIDLPVVQPTKFEFVLNLKTATALGLTIPPSVLATADEVIE
jgi:putative ABC transport system substrate-binding protein